MNTMLIFIKKYYINEKSIYNPLIVRNVELWTDMKKNIWDTYKLYKIRKRKKKKMDRESERQKASWEPDWHSWWGKLFNEITVKRVGWCQSGY